MFDASDYLKEADQSLWKSLVGRGAVLLILGICCLVVPEVTAYAGVFVAGVAITAVAAAVLLSGLLTFWLPPLSWTLVAAGVLGLVLAALTFMYPDAAIDIAVVIIGIIVLAAGGVQLGAAWSLGGSRSLRVLVAVDGIIALILGTIFILAPFDGGLAEWTLLFIVGVALIAAAVGLFLEGYYCRRIAKYV